MRVQGVKAGSSATALEVDLRKGGGAGDGGAVVTAVRVVIQGAVSFGLNSVEFAKV